VVKVSLPTKYGKAQGKDEGGAAEEDLLVVSLEPSESDDDDDEFAQRLSDGKAGRNSVTKKPRIKAIKDYSALPEGRTVLKRQKRPKDALEAV
jgi:hypothetical protein